MYAYFLQSEHARAYLWLSVQPRERERGSAFGSEGSLGKRHTYIVDFGFLYSGLELWYSVRMRIRGGVVVVVVEAEGGCTTSNRTMCMIGMGSYVGALGFQGWDWLSVSARVEYVLSSESFYHLKGKLWTRSGIFER